jgi:outer membrane immunogenic protein
MRKLAIATGCVLTTTIGLSAALASDISPRARQSPREPLYVAYNWTGPYIGLNGGGAWGSSSYSAPFASNSINTSGGLIGGTLGYNWQAGRTVFGLEGDIDWSNLRGSGRADRLQIAHSWLGTARGRLPWIDDAVPHLALATSNIVAGGGANTKPAGPVAVQRRCRWTARSLRRSGRADPSPARTSMRANGTRRFNYRF